MVKIHCPCFALLISYKQPIDYSNKHWIYACRKRLVMGASHTF